MTFEPIDNGRNLRLTCHIYDAELSQPVTEMSLDFQTIRLRDDFDGVIEQRGAVGVVIGAIAAGGKGVAIGAVIGAGGGTGTVIFEGRDRLELPRGTEVTTISGAPGSRRVTTNLWGDDTLETF